MPLDASAIAQTIQLSVTPVFLLVATGSLLNVIAGRLARVVDRSRTLMERLPAGLRPSRMFPCGSGLRVPLAPACFIVTPCMTATDMVSRKPARPLPGTRTGWPGLLS